jgi:hypothetical protein
MASILIGTILLNFSKKVDIWIPFGSQGVLINKFNISNINEFTQCIKAVLLAG